MTKKTIKQIDIFAGETLPVGSIKSQMNYLFEKGNHETASER